MITTIHKTRVMVDGVLIGVRDLTIELKLPGAKDTNRDLASFTCHATIHPGQEVTIAIQDDALSDKFALVLFRGKIRTVNITQQGDLMISSAECSA